MWAAAAQGKDGKRQLLSANVGDARVILARGTDGLQLSEDHVPDQWANPTAAPTAQSLASNARIITFPKFACRVSSFELLCALEKFLATQNARFSS